MLLKMSNTSYKKTVWEVLQERKIIPRTSRHLQSQHLKDRRRKIMSSRPVIKTHIKILSEKEGEGGGERQREH